MANKVISALPTAAAADGTELLEVEQVAASAKMTTAQIAAYILAFLAANDLTVDDFTAASANIAGTMAATHVTANTLRVNAAATPPSSSGSPSPTGFFGGGSNMLTEPTAWITINLNGTDYAIPAYTPGT
jgi:hypothetical protein